MRLFRQPTSIGTELVARLEGAGRPAADLARARSRPAAGADVNAQPDHAHRPPVHVVHMRIGHGSGSAAMVCIPSRGSPNAQGLQLSYVQP